MVKRARGTRAALLLNSRWTACATAPAAPAPSAPAQPKQKFIIRGLFGKTFSSPAASLQQPFRSATAPPSSWPTFPGCRFTTPRDFKFWAQPLGTRSAPIRRATSPIVLLGSQRACRFRRGIFIRPALRCREISGATISGLRGGSQAKSALTPPSQRRRNSTAL